jgi:hypothetical protein
MGTVHSLTVSELFSRSKLSYPPVTVTPEAQPASMSSYTQPHLPSGFQCSSWSRQNPLCPVPQPPKDRKAGPKPGK